MAEIGCTGPGLITTEVVTCSSKFLSTDPESSGESELHVPVLELALQAVSINLGLIDSIDAPLLVEAFCLEEPAGGGMEAPEGREPALNRNRR